LLARLDRGFNVDSGSDRNVNDHVVDQWTHTRADVRIEKLQNETIVRADALSLDHGREKDGRSENHLKRKHSDVVMKACSK
jgi:hypothetical protein